jgi:hypothetical protein
MFFMMKSGWPFGDLGDLFAFSNDEPAFLFSEFCLMMLRRLDLETWSRDFDPSFLRERGLYYYAIYSSMSESFSLMSSSMLITRCFLGLRLTILVSLND